MDESHGKAEVSREDIAGRPLDKAGCEETQKLLDGLEKAGWMRKDTTRRPAAQGIGGG